MSVKKALSQSISCFCLMLSTAAIMPVLAQTTEGTNQTLDEIADALAKEQDLSSGEVKSLEDVLHADPKNCRAHLLLGQYYDRLKLDDKAEEQYKLAASTAPDDAKAVVALIREQVRSGKSDSARALVDEAARRFPNDAEVGFWHGNFSFFNNDQFKAEHAYLKAVKENSQMVGLPTALAEIRLKQNRFADAYALASADILHDKKYWTAYKVKGMAAFGMGQFKEATELLSVAFEHMVNKDNVANAFALAALHSGFYAVGVEPALIHFGAAAKSGESFDESKRLLLDLWRHTGNDDARAIMERTEGSYSLAQNGAYHFAMGNLLDELALYPDALVEYQRGLEINPNYARGLFRKGVDLEFYYHQYEDALSDYLQASKLAPGDLEIREYFDRLRTRLSHRDSDLAWRLHDFLRQPAKDK